MKTFTFTVRLDVPDGAEGKWADLEALRGIVAKCLQGPTELPWVVVPEVTAASAATGLPEAGERR